MRAQAQQQEEQEQQTNVMDANYRRADAMGVHTWFAEPALQRQDAVRDHIPGPANGSQWVEQAMRMIEDSLPEGCSMKAMKDGHINLMVNQRHIFLRLDAHNDGIKMSTYQHTPGNEAYLGAAGWNSYVRRIGGLADNWSVKNTGEGSRSLMKPRSIDLVGMTCMSVTQEINQFLLPPAPASVPVWKRSWTHHE